MNETLMIIIALSVGAMIGLVISSILFAGKQADIIMIEQENEDLSNSLNYSYERENELINQIAIRNQTITKLINEKNNLKDQLNLLSLADEIQGKADQGKFKRQRITLAREKTGVAA